MWVNAFTKRDSGVEDLSRAGHPKTSTSFKRIAAVEDLVAESSCYTAPQISVSAGVLSGRARENSCKTQCIPEVFAWWVLHPVIKVYEALRVKSCKYILKLYKNAEEGGLDAYRSNNTTEIGVFSFSTSGSIIEIVVFSFSTSRNKPGRLRKKAQISWTASGSAT